MKICSRCGLLKPLDDFNQHRGRLDRRQKWCRNCESEYYHLKKLNKQNECDTHIANK